MENGYNIFNISSSVQNNSYHLYGYFPRDSATDNVLAGYNCFQVDTVYPQNPAELVTWGENGNNVNFNFNPYSCSNDNFQDYDVFTYSNAYNDTVYKMGSGNGGGMSIENSNEISEIQANIKKLKDSVNILIRKRDYVNADIKCRTMLLNYPDSVQTLSAINWLFLATISRDSLTSRVNSLKTFYESLILNNPNNSELIDKAFYFVQKCKVVLKQYQSAMQGFQLIMQQNPYSYEGLIASWDYAATHLLDSLNGHGGGYSNYQIDEQNDIPILSDIKFVLNLERAMNDMDTSKFSQNAIQKIKTNVKKIVEDSKTKQVKKVTELTNKSKTGDKKATDALNKLKALNSVVGVKKPKTHIELKKIISSDIKKVFMKEGQKSNESKVQIPTEYKLYQNYPNPFNPTTKINYDLPKDAKVTLIIYDILGREMKRVVNNEFKSAGKYSIEFNGQPFASGVYFYRLVSDKYVEVKKMVLIK